MSQRSSQSQNGQITEQEPIHPSANDLAILRHLSSLPGGFDQPNLLPQRFHALATLLSTEQPSEQLSALFRNGNCQRKHLWSFILGARTHSSSGAVKDWNALPRHRDEKQVEQDVNRSFVHYPANISRLNYFQGYHDIVSIFLLNFVDFETGSGEEAEQKAEGIGLSMDEKDACDVDGELLDRVMQRFTLHRIRDSMTKDLSPIMGYLRFTQAILTHEHPQLAVLIAQVSNLPLFSLSWILTLTSHDLTSLDTVSRLFDFLLAHEPIMICYVTSAICLTKTDEVGRLAAEAAACGHDVDLDMVHYVLAKLPALSMGPAPEEWESELIPESPTDVEKEEQPESRPGPNSQPGTTQWNTIDGENEGSLAEQNKQFVACMAPHGGTLPDLRAPLEESPSGAAEPTEKLPEISERPNPKKETNPYRRKRAISIEVVIASALRLYECYPPTDPRLQLDAILGPQSCVHSWARSCVGALDDQHAEHILSGPIEEIVKPDAKELEQRNRQARERRQTLIKLRIRALVTGGTW